MERSNGLKGKMAVFIKFKGDQNDMCRLYEIEFEKETKNVADKSP